MFRAGHWSFAVPGGAGMVSSPAVADGIVVFGAMDATVRALRATDGRPLWQFKAGDGVPASPAIHRGRVFVPSLDGALYALRLSSGALAWKKDLGGLEQSSPLIIGDSRGDSVVVAGGFPFAQDIPVDAATAGPSGRRRRT